MTDTNVTVLTGRLTKDIEVSYTQGGTAIGKLSLAVNRSVKKGDQWVDEVSFFDVTVFGKMAESLKQYLTKGKQVAVTGVLKQDRWEKDGQKFSKVSILASSVQLLGGKSDGTSSKSNDVPNDIPPAQSSLDAFPEDIPF